MLDNTDTRRTHEQVRKHWDEVRGTRRFPNERDIDPAAIPDAWDHCFLVDMRKGSVEQGYRYEYMGRDLIDAYGVDMTGPESAANKGPHIASMLRHFDEVAKTGMAAMDESEFENVNRMRILYRCCLLPLGGDKVDFILGCMKWKVR